MSIDNAPLPAATPLRGRGIVVTRPIRQAAHLAALINGAGGTPILFPLIAIRPVADPAPARERLARAAEYDHVVFVSANAVEQGSALLGEGGGLPGDIHAAAVGEGTARALRAQGVERVLVPVERQDSEGLLATPELADVSGKRVLIVRGVGGRELLAETLVARGAQVEYAECYERAPPSSDARELMAAWARRELDAITVTSSEALRNLYAMLSEEGRAHLRRTALFVTHQRMHDTARALGLDDVILADAGDEGLLAALLACYAARS